MQTNLTEPNINQMAITLCAHSREIMEAMRKVARSNWQIQNPNDSSKVLENQREEIKSRIWSELTTLEKQGPAAKSTFVLKLMARTTYPYFFLCLGIDQESDQYKEFLKGNFNIPGGEEKKEKDVPKKIKKPKKEIKEPKKQTKVSDSDDDEDEQKLEPWIYEEWNKLTEEKDLKQIKMWDRLIAEELERLGISDEDDDETDIDKDMKVIKEINKEKSKKETNQESKRIQLRRRR